MLYRTFLRLCASVLVLAAAVVGACGNSENYLAGAKSNGGSGDGPCIDCTDVCCDDLASLLCCSDTVCSSDPGCEPPPDCYDCTDVCCDSAPASCCADTDCDSSCSECTDPSCSSCNDCSGECCDFAFDCCDDTPCDSSACGSSCDGCCSGFDPCDPCDDTC